MIFLLASQRFKLAA